jgi:hypothetical protein
MNLTKKPVWNKGYGLHSFRKKQLRPATQKSRSWLAPAFGWESKNSYLCILRRTTLARTSSPLPNKASVPGSGVTVEVPEGLGSIMSE